MSSEERRIELQHKLEAIDEINIYDGLKQVWFQPPSNHKMRYPAIRYSWKSQYSLKADDKYYVGHRQYELIYIDPDPTSRVPDILLSMFEMISLDRTYSADNLNHWVFTLYY